MDSSGSWDVPQDKPGAPIRLDCWPFKVEVFTCQRCGKVEFYAVEKQMTRCPACYVKYGKNEDNCPSCGHKREQ